MSNSNSNNKFSSRIGFIAAASGAAIGLGNIWKFPYEVGSNGGAAFLIIYLIFTIIVGYPIVLTKIAFGKSTNKGLYHIYKTEGKWQIQGFAPALLCLILFSFYSIVTSWILGYSFKTITGSLFTETNMEQYFNKFISNVPNVLFLTLLINIIIAFIVSAGIKKGVELSSKILMPIFILLVISLITYGLYLENSIEGVKFYLLPNFSLITKKSIIMALSHSFFSLTIGASVMIIYGSYIKGKVNLINDAALIVTSDVFVAFLAGLLIFPFIFHQGIKPDQGASLIFITLPTIFKTLGPITGVILGFSFFLLLIFAAVTSAIPMMEVTINYIMNKWQLSRKKSVGIFILIGYTLSIPNILSNGGSKFFTKFLFYKGKYLSFMDIASKTIDYGFPLAALFFCIFIRKRWYKYKIPEQINFQNKNSWLISYIYFCIKYLAPILITVILLSNFL